MADRWEYNRLMIYRERTPTGDWLYITAAGSGYKDPCEVLNEFGIRGWELVSTIMETVEYTGIIKERKELAFYFKRRI